MLIGCVEDGHLFDLSARTQWPEKGLKSGFPTKIGLLSLETKGDDAALMSIDSKGTNIRVRQENMKELREKGGCYHVKVVKKYHRSYLKAYHDRDLFHWSLWTFFHVLYA
ncbi:hypothetical protein Tco_0929590, partial [Tanacetum coccineum]